jgi:hypothetical protein
VFIYRLHTKWGTIPTIYFKEEGKGFASYQRICKFFESAFVSDLFLRKKSAIVYSLIFSYNKTMQKKNSNFEEFEATSLYCPKCKAAVPVRKKLLLVLPEGEEYEYLCVYCSSSVGMKLDKNAPSTDLILKP